MAFHSDQFGRLDTGMRQLTGDRSFHASTRLRNAVRKVKADVNANTACMIMGKQASFQSQPSFASENRATLEEAREWLLKFSNFIPGFDARRGYDGRKGRKFGTKFVKNVFQEPPTTGISYNILKDLYMWDRTEVITAWRHLRKLGVVNEYRLKGYFGDCHGDKMTVGVMKDIIATLDGPHAEEVRPNRFLRPEKDKDPVDLEAADCIIDTFGSSHFFSFAILTYQLLCVYDPAKVDELRKRCAKRRNRMASYVPDMPAAVENALRYFEWKCTRDEDYDVGAHEHRIQLAKDLLK